MNFWNIAFEKIHGEIPNDILFIPCGGDQVEFFVNASLCRKINRKFMVVLDSDRGAVDYAAKLETKRELIEKIEDLGGEFEILRKREIENYYSKTAMQRIIGDVFAIPDDFVVEEYCDMKAEIKAKILEPSGGINFKAKNNLEVFNSMTREEWIEAGVEVDGITDLELIILKILAE